MDPEKKGAIVGPGGKFIRQILELSGASSIVIDDKGQVRGWAACLPASLPACQPA